jgi:homoserine dehydrogenase
VTSNKWPVALHGVRLAELARRQSTSLRAEATVMSGTPVLSTLTKGIAGATPLALRGVLNATANFIVSKMTGGTPYAEALAEAERNGLAERDPSADVNGEDALAKVMILAAVVFGHQLRMEDVPCRGISSLTEQAVRAARSRGQQIREVASLAVSRSGEPLIARVEPIPLPTDDPLASIDGPSNAVICQAEPIGEIAVVGPGAGTRLAGQGVLSDLLNVALRFGGR